MTTILNIAERITSIIREKYDKTDIQQRINLHLLDKTGLKIDGLIASKKLTESEKESHLRGVLTILESGTIQDFNVNIPSGQVSAPASSAPPVQTPEPPATTTPASTGTRFNAAQMLTKRDSIIPTQAEQRSAIPPPSLSEQPPAIPPPTPPKPKPSPVAVDPESLPPMAAFALKKQEEKKEAAKSVEQPPPPATPITQTPAPTKQPAVVNALGDLATKLATLKAKAEKESITEDRVRQIVQEEIAASEQRILQAIQDIIKSL